MQKTPAVLMVALLFMHLVPTTGMAAVAAAPDALWQFDTHG